jgi:dCMP deaminase
LIHQSGIKRVVYHNGYRDDSGIQFLIKAGVEVEHIPVLEE